MGPAKTFRVCRCISSHICVVTRNREQMWFTFCVESVHRIGRAILARPVHSKNLESVGKYSLSRGIKYRLNITLKSATAFQIILIQKNGVGPEQLSRYSDSLRAGRSGDQMPVGGEIFRNCPDRPWGPHSLLYNGYRVTFPRVKRPGRGVEHPPHLLLRLKER